MSKPRPYDIPPQALNSKDVDGLMTAGGSVGFVAHARYCRCLMSLFRNSVFAFLCATVATSVGASAADSVKISNDVLNVSLAIPDGTITVEDRRSGLVWRQYPPVQSARGSKWGEVRTQRIEPGQRIQFEKAVIRGLEIHAAAKWRDYPFKITVELPETVPI